MRILGIVLTAGGSLLLFGGSMGILEGDSESLILWMPGALLMILGLILVNHSIRHKKKKQASSPRQQQGKDVVDPLDDLRVEAIAAIRAGQRAKGRALLREVVRLRPNDAEAWLWLSEVVDTDEEKRECLSSASALQPQSAEVRAGLQQAGLESSRPGVPAEAVAPSRQQTIRKRRRRVPVVAVVIAILLAGVVLLGVGLVVFRALDAHQKQPDLPALAETPGRWKIVPLRLSVSPAEDGWQSVRVDVALENGTGDWALALVPVRQAVLVTAEGYTYPAQAADFWPDDARQSGLYPTLPPGFRYQGEFNPMLAGEQRFPFQFEASIAQNTTPIRLSIPNYEDVDLTSVAPVSFPGETQSPVYQSGDVLEVEGRVRLTIVEISRERGWQKTVSYSNGDSTQRGDLLHARFAVENLSQGYDTRITLSLRAIGSDGLDAWGSWACDESPTETLGPGQSSELQTCTLVSSNVSNVTLLLHARTYRGSNQRSNIEADWAIASGF